MATIHYRQQDGVFGYVEGDILIDETGKRLRVVRDGRGLCLEPIMGRPPKPPEDRKTTPVRTLRLSDEDWAELQSRGGTAALRKWLSLPATKRPRSRT